MDQLSFNLQITFLIIYVNLWLINFSVFNQQGVANELRVTSIPAFQFFKNGKLVDKFVGANKHLLLNTVSKHAP